MPEPGREPALRVQLIGPAEATHERRDTAASIAAVVVVVVRFAGELVQRVVDERVVVGIVAVGVVVVVRVQHVQRGGARGVLATGASRVGEFAAYLAPAIRARFALVPPVENDVRGVARRRLQRRGVPVGRPRIGVGASLHERIHDVRGAAERRHVQRRRVHHERAVVGAASKKRLDNFERRALALAGDAAGDAAAGCVVFRIRRIRRIRTRFRRLKTFSEDVVFSSGVSNSTSLLVVEPIEPIACLVFELVLRHPALGRLVYVRRHRQVQRRVVQAFGGALRAPERARGGGSARPHVLHVRVPRAPVGVRALRHQRADQLAVHARGGGVHGAVAQPAAHHAGADEVRVRASREQFRAAIAGARRFGLRRGHQRGAPGPARDAVDRGAGVAEPLDHALVARGGGGDEGRVAGALAAPVGVRAVFQQELHGGDVAARARERQRVVRLRRAPGTRARRRALGFLAGAPLGGRRARRRAGGDERLILALGRARVAPPALQQRARHLEVPRAHRGGQGRVPLAPSIGIDVFLEQQGDHRGVSASRGGHQRRAENRILRVRVGACA